MQNALGQYSPGEFKAGEHDGFVDTTAISGGGVMNVHYRRPVMMLG